MKFFNIDCHVSVIADIKKIFESLGHTVDSWSLSGHRWVFNLPQCNSPVINSSNWKNLDEKMVEDFYIAHKNELDKYDAFICAYPPCFLKLFEEFNKPIIVIAATRYDHPFTNDATRLNWLEDSLRNNKNIIKIANNQFDQKYCEHFLGSKWEWIPSLCNYTGSQYKKNIDKFIVFSKFAIDAPNLKYIHQSQLGRYTWKDLYSYSGIIHFPYNVSTMSLFEQHTAGVPIFLPSIQYAIELIKNKTPIFSEIVFPNNLPERQANNFLNKEWLAYCDFYNGTVKTHQFNNIDEIKPNEIQFKRDKEYVIEKWANKLQEIQ